jgi:glutamate carboxypeptidase
MVDDLRLLVTCESPSADLDAVARSADVVAELGGRLLGEAPERLTRDGRSHLRWRFGAGDKVLLLGHHDTVWPIGSLRRHPWRVADGRAYGPGCFDMKAGLVQMFHALASLDDLDGVTVLVTGDEELGAPSSRPLIEEEARRVAAVLVLEASADGGALKIARRGISLFELVVHGRAAHAGLEPQLGVNATVELAHQILALRDLDASSEAATVTPTVVSSGTTANTVPERGSVRVDVRAGSVVEQDRLTLAIRGLRPSLGGARIEVVQHAQHPPLEPRSSAGLFARARRIAEECGIEGLGGASVGGASDGNLAAGVGAEVLDGLGAVGGGAHAPGEYVVTAEMPARSRLVAALTTELLGLSVATKPAAADGPTGR